MVRFGSVSQVNVHILEFLAGFGCFLLQMLTEPSAHGGFAAANATIDMRLYVNALSEDGLKITLEQLQLPFSVRQPNGSVIQEQNPSTLKYTETRRMFTFEF